MSTPTGCACCPTAGDCEPADPEDEFDRVGDLNTQPGGDGHGDLLAQDKSNELWRYDGTATGKFKSRVKVFNDWGPSYNVIVEGGRHHRRRQG